MKKRRDQITAYLGRETEIEGILSFSGLIRIDGRFKGSLHGEGSLIVGETGVVESDIHAGRVIISGRVRGRIVATERIEILSPGKVVGDLEAPSVTIDTGVVFDGNCQTQCLEKGASEKVTFLQSAVEAKNER